MSECPLRPDHATSRSVSALLREWDHAAGSATGSAIDNADRTAGPAVYRRIQQQLRQQVDRLPVLLGRQRRLPRRQQHDLCCFLRQSSSEPAEEPGCSGAHGSATRNVSPHRKAISRPEKSQASYKECALAPEKCTGGGEDLHNPSRRGGRPRRASAPLQEAGQSMRAGLGCRRPSDPADPYLRRERPARLRSWVRPLGTAKRCSVSGDASQPPRTAVFPTWFDCGVARRCSEIVRPS